MIREHLRRVYWSTRDSHTDILILRIFGVWKDGGSHKDLSGKSVRSSFCLVKLNNENNSTDKDGICHVTWIKSKVFKIIMKYLYRIVFSSVQLLSRARLCYPMNCSTPGLAVHHQLPEFTQTHIHRVSDAIQPSHPLLSPSPPAPNPSQHHSLFQWVNSSHEVAKVLEFQL